LFTPLGEVSEPGTEDRSLHLPNTTGCRYTALQVGLWYSEISTFHWAILYIDLQNYKLKCQYTLDVSNILFVCFEITI